MYVCMCLYVCMFVCRSSLHLHACVYVCTCGRFSQYHWRNVITRKLLKSSLSVYMSACMSVCMSVCLRACLSVSLSYVCLYVCLSGILSAGGGTTLQGTAEQQLVCLYVCVHACLSVCLSMSVCMSVCQVFSVPVEERRYKEMAEQQFGDRGREQAKTCAEIMAKTGLLVVICYY